MVTSRPVCWGQSAEVTVGDQGCSRRAPDAVWGRPFSGVGSPGPEPITAATRCGVLCVQSRLAGGGRSRVRGGTSSFLASRRSSRSDLCSLAVSRHTRQLNRALHTIAVTPSRYCPHTQTYIARQIYCLLQHPKIDT